MHPPPVPLRGPAWDANNNSVVLQLAYGNITFLLAGDIESEAEHYLVKNAGSLRSDVLKAAHHGSNSSSTDTFLGAVNPRWAVISAGQDNQYGHPHSDVLSRLEQTVGKSGIFDTASQGTISFSTDGDRLVGEDGACETRPGRSRNRAGILERNQTSSRGHTPAWLLKQVVCRQPGRGRHCVSALMPRQYPLNFKPAQVLQGWYSCSVMWEAAQQLTVGELN